MDQWSPAFEQPITQVSGGSPQLPQPEDSLNFGAGDSNSLLMTLANVDPTPTPVLPPSEYENLMSQSMHSKEEFYDENLYNGMCKEDLMGGHSFLQTQGPSTRAEGFTGDGNVPGYSNQTVPNQLLKRGSFGVLPHEAVNHSTSSYERNNSDKYSTQPPSVSFNNGPYSDRDGSNIYSSAPLSAQSAFSGDTASHSPVVTSETSPSLSATFSSPDNYFNSPKTNFGAYNNVQSPMPLSPSVAPTAASYPSSPFTNVDPSGHIASTTPCSPMGGGNFMNSLNAVPQRNGQKNQSSPSNSSANLCYNNQNMTYGPQQVMQNTPPDYHADFGYAHDHNPASSYNSPYPSMHPGHMSGGSSSRISPRTHSSHPSVMPHDGRVPYSSSATMRPAPMSSPNFIQNQMSHDHSYRPCSSGVNPGQSMHPPRFPPSLNSLQNSNMHINPSSSMADHPGSARHYNFLSDPDGTKSYDPYNLVEPRNQRDPGNSFTHFLENDLPMLDGEKLPPSRQLRPSEPNDHRQNSMVNMDNPARPMMPCPPVSKEHQNIRSYRNLNYPYSSSHLDPVRPGNFSMTSTGRRRGRRGRRRKVDMNSGNIPKYQSYKDERNIYSNGYLQPSKMLDYGSVDCYSAFKKRLCDEKELPPVNYPLSRYRLELKMTENQKKNCSVVLTKPRRKCVSIEEELSFLGSLKFPEELDKDSPHTFMKTRNKDSEGFLQCYKNFLASRKRRSLSKLPESSLQLKSVSKDSSSHANREKHIKPIPKLIIKMDTHNSLRTYRLESSVPPDLLSGDESASDFSGDIPPSSHIKKENDSVEKSKRLKHSGKLFKSKHSAKHKRTHYGKCSEIKEFQTNSEHLPAGRTKVKPELMSSPEGEEELPQSPKKRSNKNKLSTKSEHKKRARKSSLKPSELPENANFMAVTIKKEKLDEDEMPDEGNRRILRSRRSDTSSSVEAIPGPSIKVEVDDNHKTPIDISSDEVEPLDDSDDDMDWTPNKSQKGGDHSKTHLPMSPKKRGPKVGRRSVATSLGSVSRPKKEKKEKTEKPVPTPKKKSLAPIRKKRSAVSLEPTIAVKREKEQFLIAKEDINKETPFLWKVDKETNMLQRFEQYDQEGIPLYRSTYTYAAFNQSSVQNYSQALVRVVSHSRILHVVEYLGPDLNSSHENLFPMMTKAAENNPSTTTPNPLRENFEVFLQTLISQALDPNFLTEITNENDEYFLSNIKEIEEITETKKNSLSKEFWEENLLKSVNTYPSVDVIDIPEAGNCEVCKKKIGSKLLQFHGQPYDFITLGSVEQLLPSQAQYNVCDICSATLSLYCRLQHQKYNFFIKCRGKMNDVIGASGDSIESHVLLEECLQDHTWVNSLFEELETLWQQADAKS